MCYLEVAKSRTQLSDWTDWHVTTILKTIEWGTCTLLLVVLLQTTALENIFYLITDYRGEEVRSWRSLSHSDNLGFTLGKSPFLTDLEIFFLVLITVYTRFLRAFHLPSFLNASLKAISAITILCEYMYTRNQDPLTTVPWGHMSLAWYNCLNFSNDFCLNLKKLMYVLKEMNPTCFGLFILVLPTFDLRMTCGVWKIFGDFQMRVNINFPSKIGS